MNRRDFKEGLEHLINAHSMEAGSNTPDWILVEFFMDVYDALNVAIVRRDKWYHQKVHIPGEAMEAKP